MRKTGIKSAWLAIALLASAKGVTRADEAPEERFQRRMPQPVKVGDLIGLPVLDDNQSTLGYVQQVVRTSAGKIDLIVCYSPGSAGWGARSRCRSSSSAYSGATLHPSTCRGRI